MSHQDPPIPPAYWDNARWAYQHAADLHRRYEGKWIAVANGQVVAAGADPVAVRRRAARETGRTTAEVYVNYMESAGAIYGAC